MWPLNPSWTAVFPLSVFLQFIFQRLSHIFHVRHKKICLLLYSTQIWLWFTPSRFSKICWLVAEKTGRAATWVVSCMSHLYSGGWQAAVDGMNVESAALFWSLLNAVTLLELTGRMSWTSLCRDLRCMHCEERTTWLFRLYSCMLLDNRCLIISDLFQE